ncbi:MAG: hypothetical protein ACPG4X_15780 [Pikeienuella sp.]
MIFGRIKAWFIAAGAAVAVVLGAFLVGKSEGKQRQKAKNLEHSLKTSKQAREKQDDINKASPDDVVRRLDGWMRDDD